MDHMGDRPPPGVLLVSTDLTRPKIGTELRKKVTARHAIQMTGMTAGRTCNPGWGA